MPRPAYRSPADTAPPPSSPLTGVFGGDASPPSDSVPLPRVGGFTPASPGKASIPLVLRPPVAHELRCVLATPLNPPRGEPFGPSRTCVRMDARCRLWHPKRDASRLGTLLPSGQAGIAPASVSHPRPTASLRGKLDRLRRTTAGFTAGALDGDGLRGHCPPWLVRHRLPRIWSLFIGSRLGSTLPSVPCLAATPWRFAITSPPSGCERDFHPQAVEHARHTPRGAERSSALGGFLIPQDRRASLCASQDCGHRARRGGIPSLRVIMPICSIASNHG